MEVKLTAQNGPKILKKTVENFSSNCVKHTYFISPKALKVHLVDRDLHVPLAFGEPLYGRRAGVERERRGERGGEGGAFHVVVVVVVVAIHWR